MKVASFFAGCGGMDLGFQQAGFDVIWANENDKTIVPTLKHNFPKTEVDERDLMDIADAIPITTGIIGGPPCQSWSVAAGKHGKGEDDPRGRLFWKYSRIIRRYNPGFFVAENVPGMLSPKNRPTFERLLKQFQHDGYNVSWRLIYCPDYGIPQERKRIIIVGFRKFRKDEDKHFVFPTPDIDDVMSPPTLYDTIWDLRKEPLGKLSHHHPYLEELPHVMEKARRRRFKNHDVGPMSLSRLPTHFVAQNRVRNWNEQATCIPASQDYTPFHPQAPKMKPMPDAVLDPSRKLLGFVKGSEHLYRRLSVRECARIQTFPDDFEFLYKTATTGYKMVGNAVPPKLARTIAEAIKEQL